MLETTASLSRSTSAISPLPSSSTLIDLRHRKDAPDPCAGRPSCGREKAAYSAEEYAGLARTLNTLGARIRDELGLLTALHPHTGTPVETPIRRV